MWRQSVPLGNAARATRRVCSGMGEGSCGCKDSGMLNAANQRGCSIFPQMQGIEFANSVNVGTIPPDSADLCFSVGRGSLVQIFLRMDPERLEAPGAPIPSL